MWPRGYLAISHYETNIWNSYKKKILMWNFGFCSILILWKFNSDDIRTHDLPRHSRSPYLLYQISLWYFFQKFLDKCYKIFTIFLWQSCQSARAAIGDFFWKDKKQELSITFDLERIFTWNFQECMWKYTIYNIYYKISLVKVVRQKS